MKGKKKYGSMNRREFNKSLMTVAVGAPLFISGDLILKASTKPEKLDRRNERSSMTYRKLGRTNFMSSRLVFGCGGALWGGQNVRLLDRAFEAGINHYDVGSEDFYKGSERSLAPFMKAHREKIWVASKGWLSPLGMRIKPEDSINLEQAKTAANYWTKLLNQSLKDLQTEYVDAYYLGAVENPALISSEEIYKAFLDAKAAGKVGHLGLSTHNNAKKILEAAIETGWYDLVMIGVTPAGWYDYTISEIEKDTPSLIALQPLLKQARDAGIGLIGFKTVLYLVPIGKIAYRSIKTEGKGGPSAFDKFYDENFKKSPLNPYQRSIAYVLEHGIDVANVDMQNFKYLEENVIAAATSHTYFS